MKKVVVILSLVLSAVSYSSEYFCYATPLANLKVSEKETDFVYRLSSNPEEHSIEFLNASGDILLIYPVQEKYDISILPAGIYTIQSVDQYGNVLTCKKFVKS